MSKGNLINEIKLVELKLHLLKAMVASDEAKTKIQTSADLYGFLRDSEDITPEDIDAVKVVTKVLVH